MTGCYTSHVLAACWTQGTAQASDLLQGCCINGGAHMNETAWQTVWAAPKNVAEPNTFVAADGPVYWPYEDGPFIYEPSLHNQL